MYSRIQFFEHFDIGIGDTAAVAVDKETSLCPASCFPS